MLWRFSFIFWFPTLHLEWPSASWMGITLSFIQSLAYMTVCHPTSFEGGKLMKIYYYVALIYVFYYSIAYIFFLQYWMQRVTKVEGISSQQKVTEVGLPVIDLPCLGLFGFKQLAMQFTRKASLTYMVQVLTRDSPICVTGMSMRGFMSDDWDESWTLQGLIGRNEKESRE